MPRISDENIKTIMGFFGFSGEPARISPLGNGHINDTFRVDYEKAGARESFVLQRVNTAVFAEPAKLMENMVNVTDHIRRKVIAAGGNPRREVLRALPGRNGAFYYEDPELGFWRVTEFIEGTFSREKPEGAEDFYETGRAFGHFQSQLSDYPAETLFETIPDFHNTKKRFEAFLKTIERNPLGRTKDCAEEIEFILERKELAEYAGRCRESGGLPLRVTHNDTKINNLMIDEKTGLPVCVVDLDTVMPGLAMYDFGDCIRTGASTAAEDERDLSRVGCDLNLFEAFMKGFITGCDGRLTDRELETLPMGALILTYEQALRFLADYIDGDIYFKTAYPEHNLVRARTQIRLVTDMEAKWEKIQRLAAEYIK